MSDLLDLVVDAHGGMTRWNQLSKVTAHIAVGGVIWPLKGWPGALADAHVSVDTKRVHTEYWPFLKPEQKGIFEATKTSIVSWSGEELESRASPRQAFEGHKMTTPWDAQNLLYFTGYAMWGYLATPFLFKLPNFKIEEVEPWNENGEVWRGLKVTFPPEIPNHCAVQTFYFDASGLLRRQDYSVEIMGGTSTAHYVSDHKSFGGLMFPTKRRVHSKAPDGKPILDRVAISIDFLDIEVA